MTMFGLILLAGLFYVGVKKRFYSGSLGARQSQELNVINPLYDAGMDEVTFVNNSASGDRREPRAVHFSSTEEAK